MDIVETTRGVGERKLFEGISRIENMAENETTEGVANGCGKDAGSGGGGGGDVAVVVVGNENGDTESARAGEPCSTVEIPSIDLQEMIGTCQRRRGSTEKLEIAVENAAEIVRDIRDNSRGTNSVDEKDEDLVNSAAIPDAATTTPRADHAGENKQADLADDVTEAKISLVSEPRTIEEDRKTVKRDDEENDENAAKDSDVTTRLESDVGKLDFPGKNEQSATIAEDSVAARPESNADRETSDGANGSTGIDEAIVESVEDSSSKRREIEKTDKELVAEPTRSENVTETEVKLENVETCGPIASPTKTAEESPRRLEGGSNTETSKTKSSVTSVKRTSAAATATRDEEREEDAEYREAARKRVRQGEREVVRDEDEHEQLEVGIVGPPTAVSELINEEELRTESVLPTGSSGAAGDNVRDHVAEWIQNSGKVDDELVIHEEEDAEDNDGGDEGEEEENAETADEETRRNRDNATTDERTGINAAEKNIEATSNRKSKRVVSNIIKRSIKCLNKIHALDAVVGGVVGKTSEKSRKEETRDEKKYRREEIVKKNEEPVKLEKKPITETAVVSGRAAFVSRNHQASRAHRNHQNQQNGRASIDAAAAASRHREIYTVKKEPTSEPETDPEQDADTVSELRKLAARSVCVATKDRDRKKRRSTDDAQNSNGSAKRVCSEQREELISSLVGNEKISAEELTTRAEQLRVELQALDQLARAKEKEWNEILSLRKLKEEAYLRIERRRQVVGFMEGNGQLNESNLTPANLSLDHEWDNVKEKSVSAEATLSDKGSGPQSSLEQSENGQKEGDGQGADQRQVGEGRQGPMVDVRTIIADYRLRHPETVPRRSRRMRNSVNVALGAGGAVVETSQAGGDSRPSSTDSCKSSSNTADPNNSMSFKDVLVQFAKLSQQQGEAVKTPQNYPDVTLHPVMPTPTPQATTVQQSGSLLHGILTKSQSPRPTTFSPTLARLLTAPERERCNPVAASTPHQAAATQQLLQAYQGSNPVSISDLLSSSKARTEITITPVVNATTTPSHSNNLIHVEDVEEDATSIEERGRSTSAREDSPPRCQGCQERAAQFVCAGCGNQWYCSRECQVSAWDEHSEVCSG